MNKPYRIKIVREILEGEEYVFKSHCIFQFATEGAMNQGLDGALNALWCAVEDDHE